MLSASEQKGFTIIELVIVMVLVGILTATALPKFSNLTVQARNAANRGVAGAFASAAEIAHATWINNGASQLSSTITIEGGKIINLNGSGWPVPVGGDSCADVFNKLLSTSSIGAQDGGICPPAGPCYKASSTAEGCQYDYTAGGSSSSTGAFFTYTTSNGSTSITDGS